MTSIERLRTTGIGRLGTPARGFRYKSADRHRVSAQDLSRIEALKIPPAWKDVAVSSAANGRLQAVGRDAAGRWQYLYHENHVRSQERKKFKRLIHFAENLPAMRKMIAQHVRRPGLPRERVMACIVRMLSIGFMRPGSDTYTSENGSYGLTTLRPRHVLVKGNTIAFDFAGKAGVQQHRQLHDPQTARVLRSLLKFSNQRVFKYEAEDGRMISVKAKHVNECIREAMGRKFSAKDFRTWSGTLLCACALARQGIDGNEKPRGRKRKIIAAIKETAEALGNTPAVSRDSYICPSVITAFEKGRIITDYFENAEKLIRYRGTKLHKAEKSLLRLLKEETHGA